MRTDCIKKKIQNDYSGVKVRLIKVTTNGEWRGEEGTL